MRAVNRLRAEQPHFSLGSSDHAAVQVDSDDVYAVLRLSPQAAGLLLVSLSPEPVTVACRLDPGRLPFELGGTDDIATEDLLGGRAVTWTRGAQWLSEVSLAPFASVALALWAA